MAAPNPNPKKRTHTVRTARRERQRREGHAVDAVFVVHLEVTETLEDGTEAVVDAEIVSIPLDRGPLTQAQVQAMVDHRKAALANRAANLLALDLDAIQ